MEHTDLIACHGCDALLRKPPQPTNARVCCPRCATTLYHGKPLALERLCAITLAALITFLIAQAFPIVELETNGITSQTTLVGALAIMWGEDMKLVAAIVFCLTILFPLLELLLLLYVLVTARVGFIPTGFHQALRTIQFLRPWGMIEVFMLGTLVTIVKMASIARIIPEAALFAFGALTLMLAIIALFDPRSLWEIAVRHDLSNR